MDVREKLVEIVKKASVRTLPKNTCHTNIVMLVNALIEEGVTVQEWVSVKDRLPKYTEEEMKRYRFFGDTFFPEFNVMILGAIKPTTLYYDGERWYDEESRCYYVTHWQCLPQPPKGE